MPPGKQLDAIRYAAARRLASSVRPSGDFYTNHAPGMEGVCDGERERPVALLWHQLSALLGGAMLSMQAPEIGPEK